MNGTDEILGAPLCDAKDHRFKIVPSDDSRNGGVLEDETSCFDRLRDTPVSMRIEVCSDWFGGFIAILF